MAEAVYFKVEAIDMRFPLSRWHRTGYQPVGPWHHAGTVDITASDGGRLTIRTLTRFTGWKFLSDCD
jgi:hypothetical protein